MIVLDTYEVDSDAESLKELLKTNSIEYSEKRGELGLQILINEADETKLNEIIKSIS